MPRRPGIRGGSRATTRGAEARGYQHHKPATIPTSRYPRIPLPRILGCPPPGRGDDSAMWTVTTQGDLPDEHEHREHDTSVAAWSDYWGRVLELEIHGYRRDGPENVEYGRRWEHRLGRDAERISVRIEQQK